MWFLRRSLRHRPCSWNTLGISKKIFTCHVRINENLAPQRSHIKGNLSAATSAVLMYANALIMNGDRSRLAKNAIKHFNLVLLLLMGLIQYEWAPEGARENVHNIGSLKEAPFSSLTTNQAQFRSFGLCFRELIHYLVTSWQMKKVSFLPRSVRYLTVSTVFTLYTWECVRYKYHSWGNHRVPEGCERAAASARCPQSSNISTAGACERITEGREDIWPSVCTQFKLHIAHPDRSHSVVL